MSSPSPCTRFKKGEDRRKKREKFYIYLDVTHTHTSSKQLVETQAFGSGLMLRIKRQAKAVAELETPFATWPYLATAPREEWRPKMALCENG